MKFDSQRCQRLGTIGKAVAAAAADSNASVTFVDGSRRESFSWTEFHEYAKGVAANLQASGVGPGSHVAVLGNTSKDLVAAIQAVWLTGATLVVLPMPFRLGALEAYGKNTVDRVIQADCTHLVLDSGLSAMAKATMFKHVEGLQVLKLSKVCKGGDHRRFSPVDSDPEDLAIIQFTSGSTSAPKGVMLSNSALMANLDAIAVKLDSDLEDEVLVSWLPLYHDMGLIGFLTFPMACAANLVLSAPTGFLTKPINWLRWIDEFNGTVMGGPNFSYGLAGRALSRSQERFDLSSIRVALCGAEPIIPDNIRGFLDVASAHGFDPGAFFPAFGMAEVCIAGTFSSIGEGLRTDMVDVDDLELGGEATAVDLGADARELAILGKCAQGLKMRIVDLQTDVELPERMVGELQLSGTSLFAGYHKNPEATEKVLRNGWFKTGDLGYLVDGELVLCGRIKDVIIIGGRNIHPQDIEAMVGDVDGVRKGNVVAYGAVDEDGKELITVISEVRQTDDLAGVGATVKQACLEAVGVVPKRVLLISPGTLPKTSSGKLQRAKTKKMVEDGEFKILN